ncbi:hypothetical protein LINPERHAP2_LOCUS198 [Linum perenne]
MGTTKCSRWRGQSPRVKTQVRGSGSLNLCESSFIWIKGTDGQSFLINKRLVHVLMTLDLT